MSLTGQRDRYFGDYHGVADLAVAMTRGFVLGGRWAPSRRRHHGSALGGALEGERLVVFAQNHDQIGNGGFGRRLASTLPLEAQFPIAAAVLCSGCVPLRFMGEEYEETAPFHYFTDHGDATLVEAVRAGRRAEIGARSGEVPPNPQDPATFAACITDPGLATTGVHRELLEWQRLLLRLRREEAALGCLEPQRSSSWTEDRTASWVLVRHADSWLEARPVVIAASMRGEPVSLAPPVLREQRLEILGVSESRSRVGSRRNRTGRFGSP